MSYKREILRLNRDNFLAWWGIMKLHFASIGDLGCKYLDEEYVDPTGTLFVRDIAKKKNHNTMMIYIATALKFDEIKDCKNTHEMWVKVKEIYGGDDNVRRAKVESLRGQFDQMRIREDENVAKYVERIKAIVSSIKASGGRSKMKIS